MGMSTHVVGFTPPDAEWLKMKKVWDACKAAGIEAPMEVQKYFDYCKPDPKGVEVELKTREWNSDSASGFEIDLDKVPKHVKVIRFYNSW